MAKKSDLAPPPQEVIDGKILGTKAHLAAALNLSTRAIDNLLNDNAIPVVRLRGSVRFNVPLVISHLSKPSGLK